MSWAEQLFGVTITAADGEVRVWHPDVRFLRIADAHSDDIAAFYLDPYRADRQRKRGGAWMDG